MANTSLSAVISAFDIQRVLAATGHYDGTLDGDLGPKSRRAIRAVMGKAFNDNWGTRRMGIAAVQAILKQQGLYTGYIDGLVGMLTIEAYGDWNYRQQNGKSRPLFRKDPIPQDWLVDLYGHAGGPQCSRGVVVVPFPLRLSWGRQQFIHKFRCHEKIAQSAERVYRKIASAYSPTQIVALGIDIWGGCYHYRKKRGGSTLSTHSWGIAIDTDPEHNQLRWNRKRARFAKPEYDEFWECWESEGWASLGRTRDYDWMHTQKD